MNLFKLRYSSFRLGSPICVETGIWPDRLSKLELTTIMVFTLINLGESCLGAWHANVNDVVVFDQFLVRFELQLRQVSSQRAFFFEDSGLVLNVEFERINAAVTVEIKFIHNIGFTCHELRV